MATRLKRLALGVGTLAVLGGVTAGTASAQAAGTFASPVSAPATQPMWIRSITPCPAPDPGEFAFVVARVIHAIDDTEDNIVWGDVRDDGHWDVTLNAPAGPSGGATGTYFVQVQCAEKLPPPTADPEDLVSEITMKYASRALEVTAGPASGAQWIDGDVGGPATTTTTTTAPTTTTTAAPAAGGNALTSLSSGSTGATELKASTVGSKSAWLGSQTDTEDIRAELVERAGDDEVALPAVDEDGVTLNASPVSAGRHQTADGGIPPWAFVCAAMLAVGTVIAYGNRRALPLEMSAPAEIDE